MFIRIMSDLHNEFSMLNIPEMPEDKETILVLAGDIGLAAKTYTYKPFMEMASDMFREVIVIMGNHEHYQYRFPQTHTRIWNECLDFENVNVLEKETVVFDGVAFICATLWTDMNNRDPLCMEQSRMMMNDYNIIRNGPEDEPWKMKLLPIDTLNDHLKAREFIFPEVRKQKEAGNKVVVVTHHGPSYQSVHEKYAGQLLNGAYVSELSEYILDDPYELHIHGHTHESLDYMIGDTRVVCNPRGYDTGRGGDLNPNFDPCFRIEI